MKIYLESFKINFIAESRKAKVENTHDQFQEVKIFKIGLKSEFLSNFIFL